MAVDTTVEVTMPQMGDSVSEGTILEWHKKEGDQVSEDEVLVEISTDKVDAEVPAPATGTFVKIHAPAGDTITHHRATPTEIRIDGDHAYDYGVYEIAGKRNGQAWGPGRTGTAAPGCCPTEPKIRISSATGRRGARDLGSR